MSADSTATAKHGAEDTNIVTQISASSSSILLNAPVQVNSAHSSSDGSSSSIYARVSDLSTAIRHLYDKLDAFHALTGTEAHSQHSITVRNICRAHLSDFRQRLQQMNLHLDEEEIAIDQLQISSSAASPLSSPSPSSSFSHVAHSSNSIGWMYAYAIPMEVEVYPQTDAGVSFSIVAQNKDKVETSLPEAEEMYRSVTDEQKEQAKLLGDNWRFVKMGIAGRGNIAKRLKTEWAGLQEAFNAVPSSERPTSNEDEKFVEALREKMPQNMLFLRRINSEMEKIIMEMFCNRVGSSYDKVAWSTWVGSSSSIGFTETLLIPSSVCDNMRTQIGIDASPAMEGVQQFLQQVQALSHEARLASPPLKLVVLHHPKFDPSQPQKHAPRLVPYFSFYKAAFKFSPKATPKMKGVQMYRQDLYQYDQGASPLYPQYHESAIAAAASPASSSATTTPKQKHKYSRSAGLPSPPTGGKVGGIKSRKSPSMQALPPLTPTTDASATSSSSSDKLTSPASKGTGFSSPFSADKKVKVIAKAMKANQSLNEESQ